MTDAEIRQAGLSALNIAHGIPLSNKNEIVRGHRLTHARYYFSATAYRYYRGTQRVNINNVPPCSWSPATENDPIAIAIDAAETEEAAHAEPIGMND